MTVVLLAVIALELLYLCLTLTSYDGRKPPLHRWWYRFERWNEKRKGWV